MMRTDAVMEDGPAVEVIGPSELTLPVWLRPREIALPFHNDDGIDREVRVPTFHQVDFEHHADSPIVSIRYRGADLQRHLTSPE